MCVSTTTGTTDTSTSITEYVVYIEYIMYIMYIVYIVCIVYTAVNISTLLISDTAVTISNSYCGVKGPC